MSALVLYVRLHDGRYHGKGDWPPSPARLFQALVAGAGLGGPIADSERAALAWLEKQGAPIIAAPRAKQSRRGVRFYMPNNDSDSIGGDPARMAKIRTATKVFQPYFFDQSVPFLYAWSMGQAPEDQANARVICSLAEKLYQLGRGIDMAWAWGELLDDGDLGDRLANCPGQVFRPAPGGSGARLASPGEGSLKSLERRYQVFTNRFRYIQESNSVKVEFRQAPQPRFRTVAYNSPPSRQVYELRDPTADGSFAPWPLERAYALVLRLRDGAVERLKRQRAEIERVLVGRKPDSSNECPLEDRVRIFPLPSIGQVHADCQIRRVLVEVPATCPLRPQDIHWAFSGLDILDQETGEILATLIAADEEAMLRHYGIGEPARHVWRTVTPAALPESARRRRIDPARMREEAKGGAERAGELARATSAVYQALRHAGVQAKPHAIRLQREPFEANGARVEAFASGSRFSSHRLWHVEIGFDEPVQGPLAIGDGRFCGLGFMAPVAGCGDASRVGGDRRPGDQLAS